MGGFVVDGLVSGLDTTNLIRSLIEAEKAPQKRLEARKTGLQTTIRAYTDLNARMRALQDAATKLSGPGDWTRFTATTTNPAVATATTTGAPTPGSLSFEVTSLARAHTVISSAGAPDTATTVVATGPFEVNGTTITAGGTGTLADVAKAINDSTAGVRATIVQVEPGSFRLQLSAKQTGAASTFAVDPTELAGLGHFDTVVTTGADATISVGGGAYSISSPSNTFKDVMPGVTFTAVSTGAATITIGRDAAGIADAVQRLVTAINDVQGFIADRSKYDPATRTAGIFLGDSLPSRLATRLLTEVTTPRDGVLPSSQLGLETDRNGRITFDRAKFLAAYDADPAAVEAHFGRGDATSTADDGLAERLARMAQDATRLNTGLISAHIAGQERQIKLYDEQISRWDLRLEARETALRRQFSAMETALGRMQQQAQWLAGQIASLPRIQP